MAGPDHRGSLGVERRQSTRLSMQPDDESDYDLDAMGISDGFRPSNMMIGGGHGQIPSQPSPMSPYPLGRRATPPPRPSSATKPKALDSFALRHDGGMGVVTRKPVASASNTRARRSSSSSTDTAAFVRFESPYQGPSGPSFPYQMYPQESRLARTASIATTSTNAHVSERSYAGPSRPTHPYRMYPQNTVPEAESVHGATRPPHIPVGFPGSNNNYQRRLGPDGEEVADMIGPDGHTEQLPPYSKYPDENFARKTRPTVQVPVDGAGGMGLATRNPEFSSQEDLNSPQSRQSIRSALSDRQDTTPRSNIVDEVLSEKRDLKKWQRVAKRKVCGIVPLWVFYLIGVIFISFGIILGATLAALKAKHDGSSPYGENDNGQYEVIASPTKTFDAIPLSTVPAGLPSLPTGSFALPISAPSAIQNGCLVKSDQSKAWSCAIPDSPLQIQILSLANAANPLASNEIIIDYGNETFDDCYPYGTQPMVLDDPQVLNLVQDTQELEKGPAWFFQTTYNKVVVVAEDLLSPPNENKRERSSRQIQTQKHHFDAIAGMGDFLRRSVAQPGDTPWFCYWNGTLLEAFLYVNLTSSEAAHGASHSAIHSASATATATATGTSAQPTQTSDSDSDDSPYIKPLWPLHDLLSAYPKVLKFQERRIPRDYQAIPPYCVRRRIFDDGSAKDVLNSTGQPIIIYLNESLTEEISPMLPRALLYDKEGEKTQNVRARQSSIDGDSCGCVWVAS